MKADIRKSINDIRKDREHGASWLTTRALHILLDVCDANARPASPGFADEIIEIAMALVTVRPGMVSISNYALRFAEEFKIAAASSHSLANIQKRGFAIASRLIQLHEGSIRLLPTRAAHLIKNRTIIMTCSYSDSICATLEHAKANGTDFKVLAIQSQFRKVSYGQLMADRLLKAGISCRLVPDDKICWHVARADMVLLGADAISFQGWLLNGSPSYELTRVAASKKISIYSICCKSKFDPRGFLASMREPEEGFDMVPLNLIAGIATESGIFTEDDIYNFIFDDIFRRKHARSH